MSATAIGAHRGRADSAEKQAARRIIDSALVQLRSSVPDLLGVMVASVDGLPLAHIVQDVDPAGVAAMASTAAGLGKRIVGDMTLGGFAESVVRGEHGYFAVYAAGRMAVLAVIATEGANLGRVHLEARRCAVKVENALEEGPR